MNATKVIIRFVMSVVLVVFAVQTWGIELDVPFKAQVPPGTSDFSLTKNCGPTSVLMVVSYHLGFVPTSQHIKDIDDWMVIENIISSVNNYDGEETGWADLVRIAKDYYGFRQITKHNDNDLALLRQSLIDGNPVIIGVKTGLSPSGVPHFMVLTGISDTDVYVNDPGRSYGDYYENNPSGVQNHYPISTFLASWATQNYCAIIINGSAGRSTMLGEKVDGAVVPEILSAYFHNGGSTFLGHAVVNIEAPFTDGHVSGWPGVSNCLFQMFNTGSLGECAILHDTVNSPAKAFVIHNQLWYYLKANVAVLGWLGGPIDQERYAISTVMGHQMVIQKMAHGYLTYDTVTGFADATNDPSGFSIAILPGNGTTLQISAYALSSTSVQVNGSLINNAVMYAVYEDNILIGYLDPSNLELTVDGLEPGSTHTYEVVAYDQNGNELTSAISEQVVLPQTPGVGTMPISVSTGTMSAEVSYPGYPGAITYYVFLDDVLKAQVTTLFATIYGIDNGTHTVKVQAMGSGGVVLAEGQKTIVMGQNILVGMTGAPAQVGPNDSYVLSIWAENASQNPIALDQSYPSYASVSNPAFAPTITLSMNAVGSIAPGQRVTVGTIAVQTANEYPLSVSLNTAVSLQFSCNFNGHTSIGRVASCAVPVVPFNNDVPELATPILHVSETTDIPVTIGDENRSNAPVELSRIELWLDDELIASLLVPSRQPRETWRTTISLPPLPAGHYVLTLVADSGNEIDEVDENDNVKEVELIVGPDAQAALDAIAAANYIPPPPEFTYQWDFVGPAGSVEKLAELSGVGPALSVVQGTAASVTGFGNDVDGALSLDGNTVLAFDPQQVSFNDTATIVMQFKTLTPRAYHVQALSEDGPYSGFVVQTDPWDGFMRFVIACGSGFFEAAGTTNVCDGRPHIAVCILDNRTATIVLDGRVECVAAVEPMWNGTVYGRVGGRSPNGYDDGYHFNGTYDYLRMSNVAMSVPDAIGVCMAFAQRLSDATALSAGENTPPTTPPPPLTLHPATVAYWAFNGSATDVAKLENAQGSTALNLIAPNGIGTTTGHDGTVNGAAAFDRRLGQYAMLPVNSLVPNTPMTFSFWFKGVNVIDHQYWMQLLRDPGVDGIVWYPNVRDPRATWNGRSRTYINGSEMYSSASLCDDQWHQLVLVLTGNEAIQYIDGAEAGRFGCSLSTSGTWYFRIGGASWTGGDDGYYFDGAIDDVSVIGAALTSQEVSTLYSGN